MYRRILTVVCLMIGCGLSGFSRAEPASGMSGPMAMPYVLGASYIYGQLTGPLASSLPKKFRPTRRWQGEKDGPVMLSGAALLKLSDSRKAALRDAIKRENPVILTKASQAHINALHKLAGMPVGIDLAKMPKAFATLDAYGLALPRGHLRMIAVAPFPKAKKAEPKDSLDLRALGVSTWVVNRVKSQNSLALAQSNGPLQLSPTTPPWELTTQDSMPASWATCGMSPNGQQCVNQITQTIDAWMVYNAEAATGQPSDYFIMQTSANVNTAGCQDFYGTSRNHSTRIAGYWLRQFNTSAQVPNIGISDMSINQNYAPLPTNPNVQVTTGTTWSISGTGTAGFQGGDGTGSLGFTGGVSYENLNSETYPALATQVNINSTPETANVASWTYDSWTFVRKTIEPGNHACGGPGLNVTAALPSIIYGGTFTPSQNWVWQALPSVRQTFGGTTLPVTVNSSLLLGWTFYTSPTPCFPGPINNGPYYYTSSEWPSTIIGCNSSGCGPSAGLMFDVACNTTTHYGTIPLGPPGPDGQDNNIGNPGPPFALPAWAVNVPFAPTSLPCPTLATLAPSSGPVGAVVTLTGTNLNTITTVNFGGTPVPSSNFSLTPENTIQVTAPSGNQGTVDVSATNTSCTSNALSFSYNP